MADEMNISLNADTERYLSTFYEPVLSAYDFCKLFFATLFQENTPEFTRDLAEVLYPYKKDPQYAELLHEIKFRSNGIFIYSNQIEDSIFNLQNAGILGKRNPSFGKIIIDYSDELCNEIKKDYDTETNELMLELVRKINMDA